MKEGGWGRDGTQAVPYNGHEYVGTGLRARPLSVG